MFGHLKEWGSTAACKGEICWENWNSPICNNHLKYFYQKYFMQSSWNKSKFVLNIFFLELNFIGKLFFCWTLLYGKNQLKSEVVTNECSLFMLCLVPSPSSDQKPSSKLHLTISPSALQPGKNTTYSPSERCEKHILTTSLIYKNRNLRCAYLIPKVQLKDSITEDKCLPIICLVYLMWSSEEALFLLFILLYPWFLFHDFHACTGLFSWKECVFYRSVPEV